MLQANKLNILIIVGVFIPCIYTVIDFCDGKPLDIYYEFIGNDEKLLLRMADLIESIGGDTGTDDSNNSASIELKDMQPSERCNLPVRKGVCRALIPRFSYDPKTKECKEFKFGGCDGNGNNFNTRKQCMEICGGI